MPLHYFSKTASADKPRSLQDEINFRMYQVDLITLLRCAITLKVNNSKYLPIEVHKSGEAKHDSIMIN